MKSRYNTHEQLFALCVLLCWPQGLTAGGTNAAGQHFVVLRKSPHSNEGNGITKLYTETTAQDCTERIGDLAEAPKVIEFTVLDYPLQASFDDKGIGAVTYRQ